MASSLAPIEQGKPFEPDAQLPLSDPAAPSDTWKSLAHSESNASIEAENDIVDRVDSVALAHMRLDKLTKVNDSVTLAKKRQGSQGSSASEGEQQAAAGPPTEANMEQASAASEGSYGKERSGSSGLISRLATKLHLKKDSPPKDSPPKDSPPNTNSPARQRSGGSPRVRFSLDRSTEEAE